MRRIRGSKPIRGEFMPGDIVTVREIAEYLKVTERTIYRMVKDKKIPAFKVGGSWRFRLDEIDDWIKSQTLEVKPGESGRGER